MEKVVVTHRHSKTKTISIVFVLLWPNLSRPLTSKKILIKLPENTRKPVITVVV